MANLQVKNFDDSLYKDLQMRAKAKNRSVSQEVTYIVKCYLAEPESVHFNPVSEFLKLKDSWEDNRSANDILKDIEDSKINSCRFGVSDELFT